MLDVHRADAVGHHLVDDEQYAIREHSEHYASIHLSYYINCFHDIWVYWLLNDV